MDACLVPECTKPIVSRGLCDTHYRRVLRKGTLEIRKAQVRTRAYFAWQNMLRRCDGKARPGYKHYGGRGISVCERWKTFANFLADMGEPPVGLSLDRINNDGNYEPGNCRWATQKVQSANRRNKRLVTFRGETKSLTEWGVALGLEKTFLYHRIVRAGWSIEAAFTEPRRLNGYK